MQLLPFALLLQDAGGAPAGQPPSSPGWVQVVPFVLMGVVVWFFMIKPERTARKKHEELLGALKKGDKVVTKGGLVGTIASITDGYLTLQVDEGVRLKFERNAVRGLTDEAADAK
jgi:preprotein translocase subunit YajC